MRTFMLLIFLFSATAVRVFAGTGSDALTGYWLNDKEDAVINVYKKNGKYYGRILVLLSPLDAKTKKPKTDVHNPVKGLRKRLIKGLVILKDLVYTDKGAWGKGTIYDPNSGKTYNCSVTISKDGKKLSIRGFVGISLFGRTSEWTRISEQEVKKKFPDYKPEK